MKADNAYAIATAMQAHAPWSILFVWPWLVCPGLAWRVGRRVSAWMLP